MYQLITLYEEPITLCEELVKLEEKNLSELSLQGQYCGLHGRQGDLELSGKSSPGSVLMAITQGELVKDVLCQVTFQGSHVAQDADMVPQLLDELNLLVQVVHLQEVAQVGITAVSCQLVQVEQALVDALLQEQGVLHGLASTLPLFGLRLSDVEEADAAPTPVLQEHQALGCLPVLVGAEQEEARKVLQGHVITVEVKGHGQAVVGGVELQGSVAADYGLTLRVLVLAYLRRWCELN